MQCVILAGGLGTRMRPLTDTCPKTLLPVAGHPFAHHQVHWLAAQGVTEIVYSHRAPGRSDSALLDGRAGADSSIRYVDEGEQLRGTAGALRLASEQGVLDESFFVIYGDSFLPVEFGPIWQAFRASGQPALMTVLRNEGRWDRSNVIYQTGPRRAQYDKSAAPGMQYIDYGLSCFRRDVFDEFTHSDLSARVSRLESARASGRLRSSRALLRNRIARRPSRLRAVPRCHLRRPLATLITS